MRRVAVFGAGLAGCALSLMLARRGHPVCLIEKDADDLLLEPDGAWLRNGVGQAGQTHSFLALSSSILAEELPDILALLERSGVTDWLSPLYDEESEIRRPRPIAARRLAYESILRAGVRSEPRIELKLGTSVHSLIAEHGGPVPRVVGLRLNRPDAIGEDIAADVVVDASGRTSPIARLAREIGCRPVIEEVHKCNFQYLTRWYRMPQADAGKLTAPVRGRTFFGGYLLCPADNQFLSLSYFMSDADSMRKVLRKSNAFDDFALSVPRISYWMRRAEPVGAPLPFAGIENRRRLLLDRAGPIVAGLFLIGDSAMYTNPTLGRGTSLAFKQAQYLVDGINQAATMPVAFAHSFQSWLHEEIDYWFDSQVSTDIETCDRLRALAQGNPMPAMSDRGRDGAALQYLARTDKVLARRWNQQFNMLVRPDEIFADDFVRARVDELIRTNPAVLSVYEGCSRPEFLGLVGGRAL